jgi:hypothetical protein
MKFLENKANRLVILFALFLTAALPSLITDSGLGIIPIERGTVLYSSIRGVYELFGSLGWTDYGNVFLHPLVFAYIVFLFVKRKMLDLNWIDYMFMSITGLISGFLTLGFLAILIVVSQI